VERIQIITVVDVSQNGLKNLPTVYQTSAFYENQTWKFRNFLIPAGPARPVEM
jgi:hypothetical protein